MRNVLLAIVVVTLPVSIAVAEPPGRQKPDPIPTRERLLPLKRDAGNSCAAYGPGFVKIDGTTTCVKVGGAIEIGAGASR
jgi:predicted secreted protein